MKKREIILNIANAAWDYTNPQKPTRRSQDVAKHVEELIGYLHKEEGIDPVIARKAIYEGVDITEEPREVWAPVVKLSRQLRRDGLVEADRIAYCIEEAIRMERVDNGAIIECNGGEVEIIGDTAEVSFPYDPVVVGKIKTIQGRVWNPCKKVWEIPVSEIESAVVVLNGRKGE